MSMQWDSLMAKGPLRSGACAAAIINTPTSTSASVPTTPSDSLTGFPPLTNADRADISQKGGCWKCCKVPGNKGWVKHIRRTCPGDASKGSHQDATLFP